MKASELIEELQKFKPDTEVEVMLGFTRTSCAGIRCVGSDDEEGIYLELNDGG